MSTEDTTASPVDQPDGSDTPGHTGQDRPARRGGLGRWLLGLVLVTLVLAFVVKTLLVQAFYIPSTSMEPGLEVGDRILVQKVSTWFDGPERGDVVVFEDPGGWLGAQPADDDGPVASALGAVGLLPADDYLVKRVIGVEGDVVECCGADGRITVNGAAIDESEYVDLDGLACAGPMTGNCDWRPGPVPEGEIFVLGDNRDASGDSSTHLCTEMETDCTDDPFVDESLVVGTVWATVWPWSRIGTPDHDPSSFDVLESAP